ncbi:MAG TPA: hypothetical protein VFN61_02350, partial [Acidimicrobiales bacterium]|nr:hypothetical protein [Acidimicrobiales bacterium]
MTDQWHELLAGADRPRALPPVLRQRLENELLTTGGGEGVVAEPIPPALRGRLARAIGGPRRAQRKAFVVAVTGVAAALAALSLIGAPGSGARPSIQALALPGVKAPARGANKVGPAASKSLQPLHVSRPAPSRTGPGRTPTATTSPQDVGAAGAPVTVPASGKGSAVLGPSQNGTGVAPSSVFATHNLAFTSVLVPDSGAAVGGNLVRLRGAGASGVRDVYFGEVRATIVDHRGPGEVVVRAPAERPGRVLVTVSLAGVRG